MDTGCARALVSSPPASGRKTQVSSPLISAHITTRHLSTSHVGLSGFDLAESIWSGDSDLTLEDLPLDSDSVSHSSASSHWSAPPLTPPATSRHLPPVEPALEPRPLSVQIPAQEEVKPDEPASPAPAYSRDPLEFDPALLASLDSQLRLRPFEAFEDLCWASFPASFPDSAPTEAAHRLPPPSVSLSRHHPSASSTNFTVHSMYSESSMATMLAPPPPPSPPPPLPPFPPSHPPPAYPSSKPLPTLPPPSPLRSTAEQHTLPFFAISAPQNPLEASAPAEPSAVLNYNDDPPIPAAATSGNTVQFFPLRPQMRPRSKSVGGTRTMKRLTSALARLRGRE